MTEKTGLSESQGISQISCFLSAQSIPIKAAKSEGFGLAFMFFLQGVQYPMEHALKASFRAGIIGFGATKSPEYAL